jgi:hypothetical protein
MDLNHNNDNTVPSLLVSILCAALGRILGDLEHAKIPEIVMQSFQCVAWFCPVLIVYFTYKNHKKK